MSFFRGMLLVLFLVLGLAPRANTMDLEKVRVNYEKAVLDKTLCRKMIEDLSPHTESSIHLAYLGAFQVIWAKHIDNIISKFATFNKGKKNIETAVNAAPKNIEIRFVRLSIQKNCPSFLGYKNNIAEDITFLESHIRNIKSIRLRKMIATITKQNDL